MANQDNKTQKPDTGPRRQPEQQEQARDKSAKSQKERQAGEQPRRQPDQDMGSRH